jgi:hypothetical protein
MALASLLADSAYSILRSTIANSMSSVASSVIYTNQTSEKELWEDIVEHDVEASTRTIESIIQQIKYPDNENKDTIRNHIVAIYFLCKQILSDIHYVKTKHDYNQSLWLLQKFRKYEVKPVMKTILKNYRILQQKLVLLEQLLSLNKIAS